MPTLAGRIEELTVAIRSKFNAIMPKLVPPGGGVGYVLGKSGGADHALEWKRMPVELAFSIAGKPPASKTVWRYVVATAMTVEETLSSGSARVSATAAVTITWKKNGATLATFKWLAGATNAIVNVSSTSLSPGDIVTIETPAQDATFEEVAMTVSARRG